MASVSAARPGAGHEESHAADLADKFRAFQQINEDHDVHEAQSAAERREHAAALWLKGTKGVSIAAGLSSSKLISLLRGGEVDKTASMLKSAKDNGQLKDMLCKRDMDLWTPLHWAARGASRRHTMILKALVQYALEVDVDINPRDKQEGWTPLHVAAQFGEPEAITILLNAGANRRLRDKQGRRAVHVANGDERKSVLDVKTEEATGIASDIKHGLLARLTNGPAEREPWATDETARTLRNWIKTTEESNSEAIRRAEKQLEKIRSATPVPDSVTDAVKAFFGEAQTQALAQHRPQQRREVEDRFRALRQEKDEIEDMKVIETALLQVIADDCLLRCFRSVRDHVQSGGAQDPRLNEAIRAKLSQVEMVVRMEEIATAFSDGEQYGNKQLLADMAELIHIVQECETRDRAHLQPRVEKHYGESMRRYSFHMYSGLHIQHVLEAMLASAGRPITADAMLKLSGGGKAPCSCTVS